MKIKTENFSLKYTLESGQCFNFKKRGENKYSGVIKDSFITIEQIKDILYIESIPKIKESRIIEYFNLDINYTSILKSLSKDKYIEKLAHKYRGLRVINQDEYECMFSYIISSFNSVKKIEKSIDILSRNLGEKITENVYSFPKIEKLRNANFQILKDAKLGYRDKFIKNTAKRIIDNNIDIYKIKSLDYDSAKDKLKEFDGIGDKVSECIMLYSMNFHNAFPEDVWIHRYLKERFENSKEGKRILQKSFDGFAGWAQLFIYMNLRDPD